MSEFREYLKENKSYATTAEIAFHDDGDEEGLIRRFPKGSILNVKKHTIIKRTSRNPSKRNVKLQLTNGKTIWISEYDFKKELIYQHKR